MSRTVIQTSENFTIRKIDAVKTLQRYLAGEFTQRSLPDKIKTTGGNVSLGKAVGKDASSEIFRFVDRSNNNQTIVTTNHALYQHHANLANKGVSEPPLLCCKYCKRRNLKSPIGLPVSMEIVQTKAFFTVIDAFCDFGCCFSFLKRNLSLRREYRGPLYMNSEQMLYTMYYRMYPEKVGERIREKPDWGLLRDNGGPLSDEEFDNGSARYVPVDSIVTFPGKQQYIKIKS